MWVNGMWVPDQQTGQQTSTSTTTSTSTGHSTRDAIVSLTQSGLNLIGQIFAKYPPQYAYGQQQVYGQQGQTYQLPGQMYGQYGTVAGVGMGAGGALDSLAAGFGISSSTLLLLGGLMLVLFMMPSPRGR